MASPQRSDPILIKRYGRRRLYDTVHCSYLTIEDLHRWAADGLDFVVLDFEAGTDVTRVLLA